MTTEQENTDENITLDVPTITLGLINPDVSGKPPVIYTGVTAKLNATLTNATGGNVTFSQGNTLEIFMPAYFTKAEVGAMKIINISESRLASTYRSSTNSFLLTYSGADFQWGNGTTIQFTIDIIKCAKANGNDTVQINPYGLQGSNIPSQISETLLLIGKPEPTRVDLDKMLAVDTQYHGEIYVSASTNPLTNDLYLEVKNTGTQKLYNGSRQRTGTPKITVSFVYGNTSGSLAPDVKQDAAQKGSAWGIDVKVSVDQTGGWSVTNPKPTDGANSPSWVMSPIATNEQIIGVKDQANVVFQFSNIYSFTPTGPTQMYVQFADFPRDNDSKYNDHTFIVPIRKSNPPVVRGILQFYSDARYFIDKMQDVDVEFNWTAFYAASISLDSDASPPQIPSPYDTAYSGQTPLTYDKTTIRLPSVEPGTRVQFTIDAFDASRRKLQPGQFAISVEQRSGIYEFSGPGGAMLFPVDKSFAVPFNWKVYQAGKIQICQGDTVLYEKVYPTLPKWNTDNGSCALTLSGFIHTLPFTLKCFSQGGKLLGTSTITVQFVANTWRDPKDQKVYPVLQLGKRFWMGSNYAYNDPNGSYWYDNDPSFEAEYGKLYTLESTLRNIPSGWRLPMKADWDAFVNATESDQCKSRTPGKYSCLDLVPGGGYNGSFPERPFVMLGLVGFYAGKVIDKPNFTDICVLMVYEGQFKADHLAEFTPPYMGFSVRYMVALPEEEMDEEKEPSKVGPAIREALDKWHSGNK